MPIPPGTRVGLYEILAFVGAGGMGEVYRANDTRLNRQVAIKFLSATLADVEARRRFQREAQVASSLNHPHILTVYDAGELDDRQYLVTEPLLATLRGDSYGGPIGFTVECLVRGDIDGAVGWVRKAAEQRFPVFIGIVIRPFERVLRQSAAWPSVLKAMNLAPRIE